MTNESTISKVQKKIQYNININQLELCNLNEELGLAFDLKDATIINFIKEMSGAVNQNGKPFLTPKIIDGKVYYNFAYQMIREKNPLLCIKTNDAIGRRIKKLVKGEILDMYLDKDDGNKVFISFGHNYNRLIFGEKFTTPSRVLERYPSLIRNDTLPCFGTGNNIYSNIYSNVDISDISKIDDFGIKPIQLTGKEKQYQKMLENYSDYQNWDSIVKAIFLKYLLTFNKLSHKQLKNDIDFLTPLEIDDRIQRIQNNLKQNYKGFKKPAYQKKSQDKQKRINLSTQIIDRQKREVRVHHRLHDESQHPLEHTEITENQELDQKIQTYPQEGLKALEIEEKAKEGFNKKIEQELDRQWEAIPEPVKAEKLSDWLIKRMSKDNQKIRTEAKTAKLELMEYMQIHRPTTWQTFKATVQMQGV